MLRPLLCLIALTALTACAGGDLPSQTVTPLRVLYLSQAVGWVHETVRRPDDGNSTGGLAPSEIAMQQMASDRGLILFLTQDARDITPERLAQTDVLVFNTTGPLPIDRATWAAITAWIESGRGGFVGIHSATDTSLDFEGGQDAYTAFIGGRFDGHPWTEGTPIRLANLDPDHSLARMWPDGTDYAEEIYQYVGFQPDQVRVIQALDMRHGPLRRPYPVPVTWVRSMGQGRIFYTNLGHTPSTWDDPRFRDQIKAAILWAGHRMDAPSTPNPQVQDRHAVDGFLAAQRLSYDRQLPLGLAPAIRELQGLHPEKQDGDDTLWKQAIDLLTKHEASPY
jgi:hypothetical protein